jgi:hypothetical protein
VAREEQAMRYPTLPRRRAVRVRRLVPLALVALLLAGLPPASAQLDQIPGPRSPAAKDQVQIYRDEPGTIAGRTEFPDKKLAVFVQPEGREWRTFRVVALRIIAAVLIVGTVLALLAFYAWRGTIRIEHGRSGVTLPRFNGFERGVHWMTAASFILMALTGLVVTFGRPLLIPLLGHEAFTSLAEASKYGHNFFSVPFTLGVIVILLIWIRDNIPERADITWIRQGGGFLGGDENVERAPGLPDEGRIARQVAQAFAGVAGGDEHPDGGPAALHRAGKLDAVDRARQPYVGEDQGDRRAVALQEGEGVLAGFDLHDIEVGLFEHGGREAAHVGVVLDHERVVVGAACLPHLVLPFSTARPERRTARV